MFGGYVCGEFVVFGVHLCVWCECVVFDACGVVCMCLRQLGLL